MEYPDLLHISKIEIPKRYRVDYGDISELARSIALETLFNPIIITQDFHLNQGGRRLSALFLIYQILTADEEKLGEFEDLFGEDFVIIINQCVDTDLRQGLLKKNIHYKVHNFYDRHHELCLELEENFQRKELTWKEEAMLIKAIHEAKQEVHGNAIGNGTGWGMRQTGSYLGISASKVSQDIKIATAIEKGDLKIASAVDRGSALKALLVQKEVLIQEELLKRKQAKFANTSAKGVLYNKDAIECAKQLKKNSFNHVITDPPYATSFDLITQDKQESQEYLEMSSEDYLPYMAELATILYSKYTTGYFICFCAFEWWSKLAGVIAEAGFTVSKTPLLWHKVDSPGRNHHPEIELTDNVEIAVVAWKGAVKLNMPGKRNIYQFPNYIDLQTRFHITQKPIELLEAIIETFTVPEDTILDLFIGSGSTCKAAIKCKRNYIGNDKSGYFEQAKIEILEMEKKQ